MRLLLVEDNRRLADLLSSFLQDAGYSVDCAGSVVSAQEAARGTDYDVIILDLGLPDGSGFDFLKTFRASAKSTPILILSAQDAMDTRVTGLNLGADDFLLKPFHNDELAARLRALLRRSDQLMSDQLICGNISYDLSSREVRVNTILINLGRREQNVFDFLMRRAEQIVAKTTLNEAVHSYEDITSENALEVCVSRLRKKLTQAHATAQIQTIRGIGYLLSAQETSPQEPSETSSEETRP